MFGLAAIAGIMAAREDALVDRVVNGARIQSGTESGGEDDVLAIMAFVHELVGPRLGRIVEAGNFVPDLLRSTDAQLQQPTGHCGSFVHVCARALQRAGYDVRIGQMLVGSTWGGHIVVLVEVGGREVVLDPLFNLAFKGPDGRLLTLPEVQSNWASLVAQCPPDYDHRWRYEGMRYTNWRGLPVDVLGSWIQRVSVRSWILNLYRVWCIVFASGFLMACIAFVLIRRRELRSRPRKRYRTRIAALHALVESRRA